MSIEKWPFLANEHAKFCRKRIKKNLKFKKMGKCIELNSKFVKLFLHFVLKSDFAKNFVEEPINLTEKCRVFA